MKFSFPVINKRSWYYYYNLCILLFFQNLFDKDNSLAIGKIFEKAFEYIGKDDLQVFLFDDEMSGDLGLTPDHEQSMTEEGKTGFNPFYKP